MPLPGVSPEPEPVAGDFFEAGFLPPRQSDPDAKSRELPRFVPLPADGLCAGQGDPWAVHSFLEMLRIYLPEVSISVALVAGAGILGGRLASRFAGVSLGLEILGAYVFLQLLFLGLNYQSIKGCSYLHSKETLRKMLLASFLILGVHILAYGLLVAGR